MFPKREKFRTRLRSAGQAGFLLVCGIFLLLGASGCRPASEARFLTKIEWMQQGQWIKADTHIHSQFSDGAHTIDEIALKAQEFGCDVIAITDHADRNLNAATPEYAEAITAARRSHPDLIILAGLEWNIPPWGGNEHATVLVPPGPDEFLILAEFKEQFDDLGREDRDPELSTLALDWLGQQAERLNAPPVVLLNHPSRKVEDSQEIALYFAQWQKHSSLVVGMSGAPGHQKAEGSYQGKVQLMDRWDPVAAEVGGVWDQLLARGNDVWAARAPSDFHSPQNDYWPGEFSETWLYVPERTAEGVLQAYHAGAFFADHGHVARNVELKIHAEGLSRPAYPGETIEVATGSNLKIELTLDVPVHDWEGASSQIDRIELIAITPEGSRIIVDDPLPEEGSFTQELKDLRGGFVLRARGRRIVPEGPDLLFYTNPIRVVTVDEGIGQSAWNALAAWITWRRILGIGMSFLLAAAGFVRLRKYLEEKEDLPAKVSPAKPVVSATGNPPHRRHFLFAGIGFLLLAFYGSLVPLNLRPMTFSDAWQYFRHEIPWTHLDFSNRSDWGANVLLYIPISFCWLGFLCLDRKGGFRKTVSAGAVLGLCLFTSLVIEFLQSWVNARVPSQNDVYAQLAGALVGIVCWFGFGQTLANWWRLHTALPNRPRLMATGLSVYVFGLIVYCLIPLDIIIHPAELYRKYREGRIALFPETGLSQAVLWGWILDVMIYLPVGAWGAVIWSDERRRRTWFGSFWIGGLVAIGIETAQIFLMSRFAEAADLVFAMAGVAIGAGGMAYFSSRKPGAAAANDQTLMRNLAWWGVALLYAGFLVCFFCWPMEVDHDPARIQNAWSRFFRVPMTALYWSSEYNAATQIVRKLFLWSVLGVFVSRPIYLSPLPTSLRRMFLFVGLVLCAAVGTGIELWQLAMPAHTADSTDVGLYTLGAGLGMWIAGWWENQSRLAGRSESFPGRAQASSSG